MLLLSAVKTLLLAWLGIVLVFMSIIKSAMLDFLQEAGKLEGIETYKKEAQTSFMAPSWALGHLMGRK
uniref:Bombesin n=1 Tax=Rana shuchinae TaxID=359668 RepID=BOMB_RANSH|nr:RecName: Full=Bombesin; AltName: Full=Bombesin-RS; Flags: Precursor [Rana shuchinae]